MNSSLMLFKIIIGRNESQEETECLCKINYRAC